MNTLDTTTAPQSRLKITEIFHSIQGESTLTGLRMSFVRLTGCPLRCSYCDTTYSYSGGKWMSIDEIISELLTHETDYVLITGGEPLAQPKCIELVRALSKLNKNVSIETDGEEDIQEYVAFAKIVMDIKTPDSGEVAKKCFENLSHLKESDEIKFVICSKEDYDWAKSICTQYNLYSKHQVLFSPKHGQGLLKDVANWMIHDRVNARLQSQLHKQIWGADTRGV